MKKVYIDFSNSKLKNILNDLDYSGLIFNIFKNFNIKKDNNLLYFLEDKEYNSDFIKKINEIFKKNEFIYNDIKNKITYYIY